MANPIGNYSRIKVWGTSDTVLATDLNAEFDNVLDNFNPEMLAGYSQNQAQMQIQTNPGSVGSESLATSIAGELERLRFMINAITGNTYWYQTPSATIAQLNSLISASAFGNRITSGTTSGTTGSTMPAYLLAAGGSSQVLTLKASTVSLNYQINGSNYVVSSDTTVSGLTLAPATQNTATVSDLTLPQAGTASTMLLGENGSQITVASMGSSISNLKGSYAAFQTTASEYLLGYVESSTQITQCFRGYFYNSSNAPVTRGTISNGDTLTLLKLTWVYVNTTGTLSVAYTNPHAGGLAPSSPAVNDYWLDTSVNEWKQYSGTVWQVANVTLIGICLQNTSGCIATRSFDFFNTYSDLNNLELLADSQNSGTVVRSRLFDAQVSVYGNLIGLTKSEAIWDFSVSLDTGTQSASTQYYFYLDTNGRPWISVTAPQDRRNDLRGYYHPNRPWRCFGYGFSNALNLIDYVESFYVTDSSSPVSNITASNNNVILPYNMVPREQVITLDASQGSYTQVLPPPAQLKGRYVTYIRTDLNIGNTITLQSWGTAVVSPSGTFSFGSTAVTGVTTSSLVAGQILQGNNNGIVVPANTLISTVGSGNITMSNPAGLSLAGGSFTASSCAGFSGTVGQQTTYKQYGINGKFSVPLITQYETYTITSDGFSYFIVQHYAPTDWIRAGTNSFTATSSNPTKGTNTVDNLYWRRVGKNAEIRVEYQQTAGGSTGSGDYLINLPTNMTADQNILNAQTGTVSLVANVVGVISLYASAGAGVTGSAIMYNGTQFRGVLSTIANGETWASGVTSFAFGVAGNLAISAIITIPIAGWIG